MGKDTSPVRNDDRPHRCQYRDDLSSLRVSRPGAEPRFVDDDRHHCQYRENLHSLIVAAEAVGLACSGTAAADVPDALDVAVRTLRAVTADVQTPAAPAAACRGTDPSDDRGRRGAMGSAAHAPQRVP